MSSPHHHRLQAIFREIFDQPGLLLTPELGPATIPEWDSVATVQLVLAVEQEFGVRLSTDEVASLRSAGDFLKILASKAG
jgi:acyl carrier protein